MYQQFTRQAQSPAQVDWLLTRSPSRQNDSMLDGLTVTWASRLGTKKIPLELLRSYPRLANRIALCWKDPVLVARLLDSLLQDRRGGRRGFPAVIKAELLKLRSEFRIPESEAVKNDPWKLLATSDR
jgi:hypothetical protein